MDTIVGTYTAVCKVEICVGYTNDVDPQTFGPINVQEVKIMVEENDQIEIRLLKEPKLKTHYDVEVKHGDQTYSTTNIYMEKHIYEGNKIGKNKYIHD